MTHRESPVEIKFGAFDDVSIDQVSQLAGELRSIDADAVVTGLHEQRGVLQRPATVALITVSTSSIAVLSVVAAFLSHIFSSGVVLDLSADLRRLHKNREQPRGTLLIVHPDAPAEFRDRASSEEIASLMNRAIGTWSTSERPPPATS